MKISDRITGPALSLFGVAVIVGASGLPSVPGVRFGSNLMPILIGTGFFFLGLAIGFGGFLTGKGKPLIDLSEWNVPPRSLLAAFWMIVGLILGTFLFQSLGFPLCGMIYMAGLMLLMGARLLTTSILSPVIVLILYYGFSRGLIVPLPAGILGGILP